MLLGTEIELPCYRVRINGPMCFVNGRKRSIEDIKAVTNLPFCLKARIVPGAISSISRPCVEFPSFRMLVNRTSKYCLKVYCLSFPDIFGL